MLLSKVFAASTRVEQIQQSVKLSEKVEEMLLVKEQDSRETISHEIENVTSLMGTETEIKVPFKTKLVRKAQTETEDVPPRGTLG